MFMTSAQRQNRTSQPDICLSFNMSKHTSGVRGQYFGNIPVEHVDQKTR